MKGNGLSHLFSGTGVDLVDKSVELVVDSVVGSVVVESVEKDVVDVSVTEGDELVEKLGHVATL